jgi:hypothetical protein
MVCPPGRREGLHPESDEGKAPLAIVQAKTTFRHRQHLGKKVIRQISVSRVEISDPERLNHRGPSMYVELEDIE